MKIRQATLEDKDAIARLHTASWLESFSKFAPELAEANKGQLPERLELWQNILESQATDVFLITDDTNKLLGVVQGGDVSKDLELPDSYDGELIRLYIAPGYGGKGIGKRLIHKMACHLQESKGKKAMVILTYAVNTPARAVYEHLGAKFVKEVVGQKHSLLDSTECVYAWENIQSIIETTRMH